MDWVPLVERFMAQEFPLATIAVLAGSTARCDRRSTSDIDLVLLGPTEMLRDDKNALAATYGFDGEVVEVFAYTEEGFEYWAQRGVTEFRPVVLDMVLEGHPVRHPPELDLLRQRWGQVLARGPAPDRHQIDLLRYAVTGLLDDLLDSADALERHVIADLLFTRTAELTLLSNGCWTGTGKYLPRRLRAWNAVRARALAAPLLDGDLRALAHAVRNELDMVGGRLQAGFTR